MKKSIWILFTAGLSVVMMLSACTKAGNIIYVPDPDEPMASTAPIVTVIYGQDGLGDRSYNDLIYLGVEEAATEYGLRTVELSPTSYEEGRGYLENMFQTVKSNRDTIPHLLRRPSVPGDARASRFRRLHALSALLRGHVRRRRPLASHQLR